MEFGRVRRIVKENGWQLALIGAGVVLLGVGIVVAERSSKGQPVTVIPSMPSPLPLTRAEVVVDVAGSIQNPGVYRLTQGSRIEDALIAAGGLAERADRSFVARFINRAQLVIDGMKVYIPATGESIQTETTPELNTNRMISINTASKSDLDALWGVGSARADTIVTNRPYASLEELTTKANIPQNVVDHNRSVLGL